MTHVKYTSVKTKYPYIIFVHFSRLFKTCFCNLTNVVKSKIFGHGLSFLFCLNKFAGRTGREPNGHHDYIVCESEFSIYIGIHSSKNQQVQRKQKKIKEKNFFFCHMSVFYIWNKTVGKLFISEQIFVFPYQQQQALRQQRNKFTSI